MASTQYLFILAIIAAILVPSILATEFVVGDDKGWTINFDYQAWTQGKEFHVGDTLVFKYKEGAHNVHIVNSTGFQQCMELAATETLTSGNDVIKLTTPGRQWYICGVAKHCEEENQKLVITVLPQIMSRSLHPLPLPSRLLFFSPYDDGRQRTTGTHSAQRKELKKCKKKCEEEYKKNCKDFEYSVAKATRVDCHEKCNELHGL